MCLCFSALCLAVLWAIGMAGGFLYKRFVVGAKGWEQVPLLALYQEFGNLEAVSLPLFSVTDQRYQITCLSAGWM